MKKYLWLGLIILLFLVTRLYKISTIPGSVYWDEASIGYNAFAISTDLKDEWGETLPLHFRAFGEFKLPVYIYSVAILTKLFGVNEITLRLPSVLYSLGTILAVYFLVTRVTKKKTIGLLSSFLLTVSPWIFIFSRTGYEAMAGLFFFVCFVYFLIFGEGKRVNILLATATAILSFYSYNSFRILVPSFFVIWFIKTYIFDKENIKKPILGILALFVFVLSLIPTIKLYRFDAGSVRLTTVGIKEPKTFIRNYFSHFSYDFLYKNGDDNDRSQVPDQGQIFFVGFPFFLMGIVSILIKKEKLSWIFIVFLLIGAIPAALTRESPHALRSILLAPTFSIISAMGVMRLLDRFEIKKYSKFFLVGLVATYLWFFGRYFLDFINNYNLKTSDSWQLPYKTLFMSIKESGNKDKIVVSDEYAQPYIFALYYLKYPPQEFRSSVKYNPPDKWGFSTIESFGNFEFKNIRNQ